MKTKPLHQMQVVKREEKEARLVKFIIAEIAEGRVGFDGEWTIVALSMDSPVVAAVSRVIGEFDEASRLSVKIVIVGRDTRVPGDRFRRLGSLSVRQAQNLRLLDAHEQLVLGNRTSWTGDCMRRNPRERDAFEGYAPGETTLAHWAAKGFERIWRDAKDIATPPGAGRGPQTVGVEEIVAAGDAKAGSMLAATSRH